MSNSNDISEKDLKKLEDDAYDELCQIIAEAMQLQDIEILDARIAEWKNKYRKLLDRPSTSSRSDFKKRIEFLLNQYYSTVTQYILSQLKLNEVKKIEKQSKAMRELYRLISDTNDYDLLKKKIKKWEDKYPISGFLDMYQKRIKYNTSEKNIKENSFKQEEAFSELVDITKKTGTMDELKDYLNRWEKKYSINDKYTIDDFIKHQTEIKRFTSDEFLQSIAREEPKIDDTDKLIEEYNNKTFSDLSVQASAYAALVSISNSPNSVDEMFRWVYKNSNIKFNDKYKALILNATYLNYSPTYLNKLPKPEIDMAKDTLSFDEYKNINETKRYAIISYFNLLLPQNRAIANDYFNKNIQVIYSKAERARIASYTKEDKPTSIEDIINSGIEIPLAVSHEDKQNKVKLDETDEIDLSEEIKPNETNGVDLSEEAKTNETNEVALSEEAKTNEISESIEEKNSQKTIKAFEPEIADSKEPDNTDSISLKEETEMDLKPKENASIEKSKETEFDYDTIVALSPLFFRTLEYYDEQFNYDKHLSYVNVVSSAVNKHIKAEKSQDIEENTVERTNTNLN